MRAPQIAMLPDGKRLHLQDGPIDLIIEACGAPAAVRCAYEAAALRFTGLLDALCDELPLLRAPADPAACTLQGDVARLMWAAVAPFAAKTFITPMAAVAGAVAQTVLAAMLKSAPLTRAYVNNGGDIALHLAAGERFTVGLVARPDRPALIGTAAIAAENPARGIATSGWRGRSFSLGIADAVTVIARHAAQADAAATIIAKAVDCPGHPTIRRSPANATHPDSDLGARLVTRDVGALGSRDVARALARGSRTAGTLIAVGRVEAAALHLQGETRVIGNLGMPVTGPRTIARGGRSQLESRACA